jgi:hypothetical protein
VCILKDKWWEVVIIERHVNGILVEEYEKNPKDVGMKRSRSRRCKEP